MILQALRSPRSRQQPALLALLALLLLPILGVATLAPPPELLSAAVLASPGDPYFSLAESIAAGENIPLFYSPAEAFAARPQFLLWVVAPSRLSDRVVIEAAQLQRQYGLQSALGLITASNLSGARALYQRGQALIANPPEQATTLIAAGVFPTVGLQEGVLRTADAAPLESQALTVSSLLAALPNAQGLHYNGHGGSSFWGLAPGVKLEASMLLNLPPLVVSAVSCQTLRPWRSGSIALGFIDHGAAAYAGFVYSPLDGYFLGERRQASFQHTWPGFTIGQAALLHNAQALKAYAALPFFLLIGDPRLALRRAEPAVLSESVSDDRSLKLTYQSSETGLLALRIPGGSQYTYFEIFTDPSPDTPGAAASDRSLSSSPPGTRLGTKTALSPNLSRLASAAGEWAYNSQVQAIDLGPDKLVMFENPGASFTIQLWRRPPFGYLLVDNALDALDHAIVFNQDYSGWIIILAGGLLAALLSASLAWRQRRDHQTRRLLSRAVLAGVLLTLLYSAYLLLRQNNLTTIEKPVAIYPQAIAGFALLQTSAAFLWLRAVCHRGRWLAFAVASLPFWLAAAGMAGIDLAINSLAYFEYRAAIYGYQMARLPLLALFITAPLFVGVFRLCETFKKSA